MTTTQFTINAKVPGFGKMPHAIRVASEDAAIEQMARTYPDHELNIDKLLTSDLFLAHGHVHRHIPPRVFTHPDQGRLIAKPDCLIEKEPNSYLSYNIEI